MHVTLLAAVPALSLWLPPASASEDAFALAAKVQRIRQTANFRASGRLAQIDAQGRRTTYRVALESTALADGLRLTYDVTAPGDKHTRIQVETRAAGPSTVRGNRPGESALKIVPFEEWQHAILGTGITYEDLVDEQFRWSRQTLGKSELYGARLCFVLKSVPGPSDLAHYAQVTSWLDEKILHPVKVEKAVRGTGAVKEFIYYGLRKSGGLWSASQIEVRMQGQPGSTFLIITRGSVDKLESPR